ncbi:hypothetical protein [Curtobacterium flaccumfaciens]|uniref:hypothetical protein n=1 Tax=Curtobacterium flaccumfaciens TaxID=2035 RepID=UPI00265AE04E|nr:hypothetical protein [Curtobacterium flaccumfaciens]MCS0491183.1 hypothetical protein [Curtobacterium flaccumfaciens pv. betae]
MNDEILEEAVAYARYEWDCPECQTTNEIAPGVDFGDEECSECGETIRVVSG